ncbi:MAG: UMP kinase [DPANN group archaeon]|nr:UMP kinase [DPANN group archaeon]
MRIVLSLGGSLLTGIFSSDNFVRYAEVIKAISDKGHKLIVVVGGGKIARDYINVADGFNASDFDKDYVAIKLTWANAALFASALGDYAETKINISYDDIVEQFNNCDKVVVCGGIAPGQSTDGVSAKLARAIGADIVINATDVSGVYDSDPRLNVNANKFENLTFDQFRKIISKNEQAPGKYGLFDLAGIDILQDENIDLLVIDGTNPNEILQAVLGEYKGTLISLGE